MDGSDHDHALQVFSLAEADLRAMQNMLDEHAFSDGVFGFHAQQAVEKALKAWIAFLGLEYPKTHDVRRLLLILVRARMDLSGHSALEDYTAFAVQYRYEAFVARSDPLDRPAAIRSVEALFAEVRGVLASRSGLP